MAEPLYRIGTVARMAGISTHALRAWERRYGVPAPERSEGGARLYSEAEVERLRLLKRAVDRGHAIGRLVPLDRATLERVAGAPAPLLPNQSESTREIVDEFVAAVREFDGARAEQLLDRAAVLFSARSLVLDVMGPLLVRIGDDWSSGSLCSASEHVGSALVRDRASALMRGLPVEPGAERIVAATPAGEMHELGVMLAATTAKLHGYEVLYLGPNLPASEIALAARASSAGLIALSVIALDSEAAAGELAALMAELPTTVSVVVGGPDAQRLAERHERVIPFVSLAEFERFLVDRRASRSE
jgi:DNA-binding transcriptional MerR regulator